MTRNRPTLHTRWPLLRMLAAAVMAFVLASCASTRVLQPVPASTANMAKVTFIRQKLEPTIREYRLVVHETQVATLADNDFVTVYVPVGDNYIHLDIEKEWPFSFTLPVKSTEPLFVVISGESRSAGAQSTGYQQFTVNIRLTRRAFAVSRDEAEKIVSTFGKKLP